MTVYYYDLFTGTAGTPLTSHTADSGATWPNDADHYYGTGIVTLDGLGGVYQSNTGSSINLSSAVMPSTQNFEVLFSHVRETSIAANAGLILLSSSWPTIADCYELFYAEGDGWLLYHTSISGSTNTLLAGPYAGPAYGVTWYMKVDVSTSGGNTTFAVYYSIASTGPFAQLFSYTTATSTDLVAVGTWFYNPSTASTATTGQHIGALTVQDIPPLSTATLSGPTQQLYSNPAQFTVELNEPAGTGGVVVTLSSSNSSDTFQATQGGADLSPKQITIAANQLNGTFWLTPGRATGNRTISITTSPALTYSGSPFAFNAMTTATGYTVTGVSGGHQLVPVTWTIALTAGDFSGTITATPGGGSSQCQIFNSITTTFLGNGTTFLSFVFTPLIQDSVTFTFTNSGSLTNPSPMTFTATRMYYEDTFNGSAGTSIASWSSNLLPGLSGSPYTITGTGTIELDGNGMCFLSSVGDTYALTQAVMPAWTSSTVVDIQCNIIQYISGSNSYGGLVLMSSSGEMINIFVNSYAVYLFQNGSFLNYNTTFPSIDTVWTMRINIYGAYAPAGPGYGAIIVYYSNDGINFVELLISELSFSSLPTAISVGPYLQGDVGGLTTGFHVGNIVVQDMPPAPPTCQISKAYVTTSGQSAAFFFETISGSTPVFPTALNYAPVFFKNGTSIGFGTNSWITGYHNCAIIQFQPGVQVNPGDTVTVSAPATWMLCGSSNAANQVVNLEISNYTEQSCFGTDSLVKTFKPGLNFSDYGTSDATMYIVAKNWRLRCSGLFYGPGGSLYAAASFLNQWSNGVDSTGYPGITGYWAIGFDDMEYSTYPWTVSLFSQDTSSCTVTQIHGNNNPGTNGQNQYYLFEVAYTSGTNSVDTKLGVQCTNGQPNPNFNQVGNFWIVGPGDFVVPAANDTTWSFDRSNPYALSNQFLSRVPNSVGSCRWVDSTIEYSFGQMTQPWQEPQLDAFSWNGSANPTYTITFIEARPLVPPGTDGSTSYIYSDWLGSQGMGSTWTCSSGLGADITDTTQTTITINSASADPIFCGILIQIDSEQMQVESLSGTSTLTVFRAACGTTAATHANGAVVTIVSKRWAWTSLSQLVGSAIQAVEIVCENPHGLTEWTMIPLGNSQWPTLNCADGSTVYWDGFTILYGIYGPWITGPNTFAIYFTRSSGTATTLSASSGAVSIPITWQPGGGNGFPMEFIAMATAALPGANIHVNIPMVATDAYVWDVAAKIRDNFPAGRRVYVEYSDEPWNFWPDGAYYTAVPLSSQVGESYFYFYMVVRTGQIREIFRSAFGSRADEIYAIINMQEGGAPNWTTPSTSNYGSALGVAAYHNVPIDACAVANYIYPDSSAATVNAWNNSVTIQQLVDLLIHDTYYNTNGLQLQLSSYNALIAGYNAYTGNNCVFYGYEGGLQAPPSGVNNENTLTIDIGNDPLWTIAEQDFYALLQRGGYVNSNIYSYAIYYSGANTWGVYHSLIQPYGYGDGSIASDGKAYTNRNYFITPGFKIDYTGTAATNWIANTASVRGQALLEWMQPAQGKKRMLFVPYRFVNR